MQPHIKKPFLATLFFVVTMSVLCAATVTLPSTNEGYTDELEPMALSSHDVTVQYVYASSVLAGLSNGLIITGLSFRTNGTSYWPSYPEDEAGES